MCLLCLSAAVFWCGQGLGGVVLIVAAVLCVHDDWGMFGSLMAEVLADDEENEAGGPDECGWRDAGWRDEESDDSSLGSVLQASAWADESEEEEEDEKMMEERAAEVTELDEMLAEQESMDIISVARY